MSWIGFGVGLCWHRGRAPSWSPQIVYLPTIYTAYNRSWVLAMLAVLDGAVMHLALAPETAPSQARLCLQMGFIALQRISVACAGHTIPIPCPTPRST